MSMNCASRPGPGPSKAEWRALFRALREGLDAQSYQKHSAAIVERTLALPEVRAARCVHAYWPLTHRREVDTRPLIRQLRARGTEIVLPVVAAPGPRDPPLLRHVLLEDEAALRPNRWGIPEPTGMTCVSVTNLDVILVPALGAGRNGHRIGHGRGFYDAFLHEVHAPTVCLTYARCLTEAVPAEAHDVPVSVIVTESEVVRPAAS